MPGGCVGLGGTVVSCDDSRSLQAAAPAALGAAAPGPREPGATGGIRDTDLVCMADAHVLSITDVHVAFDVLKAFEYYLSCRGFWQTLKSDTWWGRCSSGCSLVLP